MSKVENNFQNVRGTKDLFGLEMENFNHIVALARNISANYGFKEISTPIFEFSEVFERNLGDESDIISKEVYKFLDRSDNFLTLRPEFTAAIVRSFINHSELNQILPQKFFSFGPIFRYDRPQKGRQRQFHQINFEIFGIEDVKADIEAILMSNHILENLNIANKVTLQINSLGCNETKAKYELALKEYFQKFAQDLSFDSQRRLQNNPLRILDSKDKKDQEIVLNSPNIHHFYSASSKQNLDQILLKLSDFKINYQLNSRLVRGLDYYTSTVFEFVTNNLDEVGAQNTVLAGGRYDNLVAKMKGKPTPAIGFAAGIERLMLLNNFEAKNSRPVFIIYVSNNEEDYAFNLVNLLRKNDIFADFSSASNMKKQLKKASQANAKMVLIIGEDEVKSGILKVKDFDNSIETPVAVQNLIQFLKK